MDIERAKDLKRRFDLIGEALDGLSNHDCLGLLAGMVGCILKRFPQKDMHEERPRQENTESTNQKS